MYKLRLSSRIGGISGALFFSKQYKKYVCRKARLQVGGARCSNQQWLRSRSTLSTRTGWHTRWAKCSRGGVNHMHVVLIRCKQRLGGAHV